MEVHRRIQLFDVKIQFLPPPHYPILRTGLRRLALDHYLEKHLSFSLLPLQPCMSVD